MAKKFKKKLNRSVIKSVRKSCTSVKTVRIKTKIDDCLDLHGYTKREAYSLMCDFFENAEENDFKILRIIIGKGLDGYSPLKVFIEEKLKELGYNYKYAPDDEGGEGVIDIYLII